MNKISPPNCNDRVVLKNLADNTRVNSYPCLKNNLKQILRCYKKYNESKGNVLKVANLNVKSDVKNYLKSHYKNSNQNLKHISEIRAQFATESCPMCGSLFSCWSLDHLLPQDQYGEFAIFSLNLVPACQCNILRGNKIIGNNPGERVLHPYFDECLAERLIIAKFENLEQIPNIRLSLCITATHPEFAAINFHLREIVEKTSILTYLNKQWNKLCLTPSSIIRELEDNPESVDQLKEILQNELKYSDKLHNGKNNWYSIFIAGLLDNTVLEWLLAKLKQN